jgi:hypothetical protein
MNKQLLNDRYDGRGYCKLKEEAVDRFLRCIRLGSFYGNFIRIDMKP